MHTKYCCFSYYHSVYTVIVRKTAILAHTKYCCFSYYQRVYTVPFYCRRLHSYYNPVLRKDTTQLVSIDSNASTPHFSSLMSQNTGDCAHISCRIQTPRKSLFTVLTAVIESQLVAYDFSIVSVPEVITHSPPLSRDTDLHSSLVFLLSSPQSEVSIKAIVCRIVQYKGRLQLARMHASPCA